MLALYYVIFGVIYNTHFGVIKDETGYDGLLAMFLGLSLFHAFSETLSWAPGLITTNPNFVKKTSSDAQGAVVKGHVSRTGGRTNKEIMVRLSSSKQTLVLR